MGNFMFERMFTFGFWNFWSSPLFDLHPDGPLTSDEETRPIVIPVPQWQNYKGVQLFDLEKDPYEKVDTAAENVDLVNELVNKLHDQILLPEPPLPQIGSIVFNFTTQMKKFRLLMGVVIFGLPIIFALCFVCCIACCARSKGEKSKLE